MSVAAQPRWFHALNKALSLPENKGKIVYQLATVDSHNIPHVRSLVHRDFLIPKGLPSVPILLTTTDVRTSKVTQLLSNPTVEIAWWLEGSQDQFRIAGKATVIPCLEHPFHNTTDIPRGSALAALTSEGEQSGPGQYDWEQKRREAFDSVGGHLRASWLRPSPDTVLQSYEDAKGWPETIPELGNAKSEEEEKLQHDAFDNFALLLIEPVQVDWVQLGVQPNQRTNFTRLAMEGNGGEWKEEIRVP